MKNNRDYPVFQGDSALFKTIRKMIRKINQYSPDKNKRIQGRTNNTFSRIPSTINKSKEAFQKEFKNSGDLILAEFQTTGNIRGLSVYLDGMINKDIINRDILGPLIRNYKVEKEDPRKYITAANIKYTENIKQAVQEILKGNTVILLEGLDAVYIVDSKGWDKRAVEQPDVESVIRGPREGFVESIRVNTSLIRRKIKNNHLIFENIVLGKETKTDLCIGYIEGIVNKEVLGEVKRRIGQIDTDAILETGYIEQYIEDEPFSIFPTVGNTQKPDVAAAKLLEGRVIILCDGTPHALTIPYTFIEGIQTSEDYFLRPYQASFLRIIRFLSFSISVMLPSLYVALTTFHHEMIPTVLLVSMAGAREGIPLPSLVECFVMIFMFEILRESGTRLPRPIGSAISIVGALIIGESAVKAGLVSTPMVIITALTAVTSFALPTLTESITFYRFIFLFLGGFMGLYGIVSGLFIGIAHAVSLRSFGVPYTTSFAPINKGELKDSIIRYPLWMLKKRPESVVKENIRRQDNTRKK
ncbi:GerA spore germination protein [Syntrophobotulus glycolicus DSM 8271]|uniref:GerA spore germination protein n=1 Tax=Syntrophobotulus glycolicus (strain DSM 8271 / FlGlyR) TaxID=645991 RepID=F0SUW5_SYNGF|nr:GerA spore germination protein [Syntrophobotulus glycolicus DSM 8271]